jgi:hypothetical protein
MESNTTAIEFIICALILVTTVAMFAVTLTARPAPRDPGKKRSGRQRSWAFFLIHARSALASPLHWKNP